MRIYGHLKARAEASRTFTAPPRFLAVIAINAARNQLCRYALATDWPEHGVVEAADLLDQARDLLAQGGEK
jgi:predicted lysophospholipase L1 biosynthesis ABC-type transport system permease subunit